MKHRLNAYKDGYKWVIFCEICGQDEPEESDDCSGHFGTHDMQGYGYYGGWMDLTIPKKLTRY